MIRQNEAFDVRLLRMLSILVCVALVATYFLGGENQGPMWERVVIGLLAVIPLGISYMSVDYRRNLDYYYYPLYLSIVAWVGHMAYLSNYDIELAMATVLVLSSLGLVEYRKERDYWVVIGVTAFYNIIVIALLPEINTLKITYIVYSLLAAGMTSISRYFRVRVLRDLEKYKLAIESSASHIVITDPDGVVQYANQAVTDITGYTQTEIIGKPPKLWGGLMSRDFYAKMWRVIKTQKRVFEGEVTNRRKNGEKYIAKVMIAPILDDEGKILRGFIGIEDDITSIKMAQARQEKLVSLMVGRELKMREIKQELNQIRLQKNEEVV